MPMSRLRGKTTDAETKVCYRYRLRQIVARTLLNGLQCGLCGVMASHQKDFRIRALLNDRLEHLHAVTARHDQVQHDDIGLFLEDDLKALIGIRKSPDLQIHSSKSFRYEFESRSIIVNRD